MVSNIKDNDDFHFYRKDYNTEKWSHKPGGSKVSRYDASHFIKEGSNETTDEVVGKWRKEGHLISENYDVAIQ